MLWVLIFGFASALGALFYLFPAWYQDLSWGQTKAWTLGGLVLFGTAGIAACIALANHQVSERGKAATGIVEGIISGNASILLSALGAGLVTLGILWGMLVGIGGPYGRDRAYAGDAYILASWEWPVAFTLAGLGALVWIASTMEFGFRLPFLE
ncbi:MAG: hypothetical protein LBE25_09290 [Arthrobacter sp.]|jgi:hypothetical protein|nr:hypothetical protein [Arthrobacter sp.]